MLNYFNLVAASFHEKFLDVKIDLQLNFENAKLATNLTLSALYQVLCHLKNEEH